LFVGGNDIAIYEPQSGRLLKQQTAIAGDSPTFFNSSDATALHLTGNHGLRAVFGSRDVMDVDLATGLSKVLAAIRYHPVQFTPDGEYLAGDLAHLRRIWRVSTGEPVFALLTNKLLISPAGHVWTPQNPRGPLWPTSPGIDEALVYIVKTDRGQETLTPLQFANRYGWQNDPSKVRLK
jgi:hypothetical protein